MPRQTNVRQAFQPAKGSRSQPLQARGLHLEFLHLLGHSRAPLSPLPRGTPRCFAAGGLDFTTEDPLWSPFSRGTKEPDQGLAWAGFPACQFPGLSVRGRLESRPQLADKDTCPRTQPCGMAGQLQNFSQIESWFVSRLAGEIPLFSSGFCPTLSAPSARLVSELPSDLLCP